MAKIYCTCKDAYTGGYYGLFAAGPARDGSIPFVHECGKPSYYVWLKWLALCDNCLGQFSSPWEMVCCRDCMVELDLLHYPYRTWKWARQQRPAWGRAGVNKNSQEITERKSLTSLFD